MSRSSPGVGRVAAILNFIADHPGQAFALTDLVRALKLSRATCHALLTGLVDVGYLYRTSDKTYVLGPALVAIGRTAADHFSPLQVAQPEMRSLADDFDVVCGAYFLEGDTVHLRDRAASVSHVGYPIPLGTRMTLRSAQAIPFYAGAPKDAEAWLARTSPKPTEDEAALMFQAMEFTRQHGFAALVRRSGTLDWLNRQDDSFVPPSDSEDLPVKPIVDIAPGRQHPVAALLAPVTDGAGKVQFMLVMAGFNAPMSGEQVMAAGERLASACRRISAFLSAR